MTGHAPFGGIVVGPTAKQTLTRAVRATLSSRRYPSSFGLEDATPGWDVLDAAEGCRARVLAGAAGEHVNVPVVIVLDNVVPDRLEQGGAAVTG